MQLAGAAVAGGLPLLSRAQGYPDKPVRVIVPYAAGGGLDAITRLLTQAMGESLHQPFIVDNRAGAGGMIGAEAVARAAPDGYTLLMAGNPELVITPAVLAKSARYNVVKDFAPIMLVSDSPNVLFAHPSVTGSLADLLSGKTPVEGGISIATPGPGSPQHVAVEVLKASTKQKVVHVPYKGAGPAVADVLGGQVKLGLVGAPPVIPNLKAGKLRALAVTERRRSPLLPDVPTVEEATGIKGVDAYSTWYGLLAPAATPQAIIDTLYKAIAGVMARPEMKAKLEAMATEPLALAPAAFAERIRTEAKRYEEVVRRYNIKGE
jgi:tripartite-type tricarboxylate transporter receptor subunit TctC